MADTEVLCPRCGHPMARDPEPYAIPQLKHRGSSTEGPTVSTEKSRMVELWRCPDSACRVIELKAAAGWPVVQTPARTGFQTEVKG
jgi:hypothetical protein